MVKQAAGYCSSLPQASLVKALEVLAAVPDSQQLEDSSGSNTKSTSEPIQPQQAAEDVAAAAVASRSTDSVPAAISKPAPQGPDTAAGSEAAVQGPDAADLTAAYVDAHSQSWQSVMQQMVAWVRHKQGHEQQQQMLVPQQELQEQQLPEQPDSVQPCLEVAISPQQVRGSYVLQAG
jgi:hypothetical protein